MFSRRKFLCGASTVALSVPLIMQSLTATAEAASSNGNIFVLLAEGGGNDTFNMIFPLDSTGFGNYQSTRAGIAATASDIQAYGTAFDGNTATSAAHATQYAMYPYLGSTTGATNNLRSLYARGKLAVIAGVGLPTSAVGFDNHEQATEYWQWGLPYQSATGANGWLGKTADNLTLPSLGLVAYDGYQHPELAASTVAQIVVNGDLGSVAINYGNFGSKNGAPALTAGGGYALPSTPAEFIRSLGNLTTASVNQIHGYALSTPLSDYPTSLTPLSGTGAFTSNMKQQFQQVARQIIAGSPTKIHLVGSGGWDTHSAQNGSHPTKLQEVSESVTEFLDYLTAHNAGSNVIVMTASEFGRRPYVNASDGTDHGTASIHLIAGAPVKGGVYGQYPSLLAQNLDSNGDAKVQVDFRTHLSVAIHFLGGDFTEVLGTGFESPLTAFPGLLRTG